jgi:putative ABC transport system permease protein
MFLNYLKISVRNILKYKLYSLINITGLAIGMGFVILTFAYIHHELNFNKFHTKYKQIYRVTADLYTKSGSLYSSSGESPELLAALLKQVFPEVLYTTKMRQFGSNLHYKEKNFHENNGYRASKGFFDVFDFHFIKGDPKTALKEPNSIVLTESTALKYFNNEDPLNKCMDLNNIEYKVTGVLSDIPNNSDIRFDYLVNEQLLLFGNANTIKNWIFFFNTINFIVLNDNVIVDEMERKINLLAAQYMGEEWKNVLKLHLQPLSDLHLYSNFDPRSAYKNELHHIYILSAIALLLLTIALINFINISIGLLSSRVKEIGVRKVMGAGRIQIIKQFLGESYILTLISALFGISLAELFLPAFNILLKNNVTISFNLIFICFIVVIILVSGFISTIFISMVFTKLSPADILGTKIKIGGFNSFTKSLVIFQFALSVMFIITAIFSSQQMNYVINTDKGYKESGIIVIPIFNLVTAEKNFDILNNLKISLLKYNNIISIAGSDYSMNNRYGTLMADCLTYIGSESIKYCCYSVDYDYIKTLSMIITEGRDFSREFSTDARNAVIINESFAKILGQDSPIGKQIDTYLSEKRTVIGVVKDFNYQSLHSRIKPLALGLNILHVSMAIIKIKEANEQQTIDIIKEEWKKFFPESPFTHTFLKDDIKEEYEVDKRVELALRYAAFITVFISCIGILSLTSLLIVKQRKEISIRKIFGASVTKIALLLSKEYLFLILISFLIAFPAAYHFMDKWLENFTYRINLSIFVFLFSGIAMLLLTLITIGYQLMKASRLNPVDALKEE